MDTNLVPSQLFHSKTKQNKKQKNQHQITAKTKQQREREIEKKKEKPINIIGEKNALRILVQTGRGFNPTRTTTKNHSQNDRQYSVHSFVDLFSVELFLVFSCAPEGLQLHRVHCSL